MRAFSINTFRRSRICITLVYHIYNYKSKCLNYEITLQVLQIEKIIVYNFSSHNLQASLLSNCVLRVGYSAVRYALHNTRFRAESIEWQHDESNLCADDRLGGACVG